MLCHDLSCCYVALAGCNVSQSMHTVKLRAIPHASISLDDVSMQSMQSVHHNRIRLANYS